MKLEVGCSYLTRDGRTVTISLFREKSLLYQYHGYLSTGELTEDKGEWTENGRYMSDNEDSRFDIVKKL